MAARTLLLSSPMLNEMQPRHHPASQNLTTPPHRLTRLGTWISHRRAGASPGPDLIRFGKRAGGCTRVSGRFNIHEACFSLRWFLDPPCPNTQNALSYFFNSDGQLSTRVKGSLPCFTIPPLMMNFLPSAVTS